jgi:hypothetical protein
MNHIEFKLRLHHPSATPKILNRWFRIFYLDLIGDDDIYNIKYSCEKIENSKVIFIKLEFQTPMIFEEFIEFMQFFIEFESAEIYTIYNVPVSIELSEDRVSYNKEVFYLQDLTIRNSRMNERLSELKFSWNQIKN